MKIHCQIPDVCLTRSKDMARQVRLQLVQALNLDLSPVSLPKDVTAMSVDFGKEELVSVREFCKSLSLKEGRVIGGMLYALHLAGEGDKMPVDQFPPVLDGLRPGQTKCISEAAPLLRDGKIILAECGTGSGKSRLIAHAAAYVANLVQQGHLLRDGGVDEPGLQRTGVSDAITAGARVKPAWLLDHARDAREIIDVMELRGDKKAAALIAAPTVETLTHLVAEWNEVRPVIDPNGSIKTAVSLGRGQFVSKSALLELLDLVPEDERKEVLEWVQSGMQAGLNKATAALKEMLPDISALMSDLETVAAKRGLNLVEAAMDDDSPAEEQLYWSKLRGELVEADVIFATHAMLCLDTLILAKDQMPLLPRAHALFVDEAHLLEQAQASMASKSLSFDRLNAVLKLPAWSKWGKTSKAKAAISAATAAHVLLKQLPGESMLPLVDANRRDKQIWDEAQAPLKKLRGVMKDLLATENKAKKEAGEVQADLRSAVKYVKRSLEALARLDDAKHRGYLSQSPKEGQVSITLGPSSVEFQMTARWAITPAAMMLSATLLHHQSGDVLISPILHELSIPKERGVMTTPIHPHWITDTPTLMMPSKKTSAWRQLVPPQLSKLSETESSIEMAKWFKSVAKALASAADTAKGGTLVLMTGYDRVAGLVAAIEAHHPELLPRLIEQKSDRRTTACASAFRDKAKANECPIWIATGPAWTGLDLKDLEVPDSEAHKDFLLTDLVMPALPFGMERNTVSMAREEYFGWTQQLIGVQRRMRQGIGRLMRRSGLVDRRIWMLDGRLRDPGKRYAVDLNGVLGKYAKTEIVSV